MTTSSFRLLLFFSSLFYIQAEKDNLIKPLGDIYFYENEYSLHFDIDLKEYFNNAIVLRNSTQMLKRICDAKPETNNCIFFSENIKNITTRAMHEVQYIKALGRKKRFVLTAIVGAAISIAVGIMGFLVGLAAGQNEMNRIKRENKIKMDALSSHMNITERSLQIQHDLSNEIMRLNLEINRMNTSMYQEDQFGRLISMTLLTINKHNLYTKNYLGALSGDLREKFFDIINIQTFEKALSNIHENVNATFNVVKTDPWHFLQLSTLSSAIFDSTLRISVKTPIISQKKASLYQLIPIPHRHENSSFILNLNTKFLMKTNETYKILPPHLFPSCIYASNITLCNSLLIEQIEPLDNCTSTLVTNGTEKMCTYKELPNKNQIIRLSDTAMYCYIQTPMQIKISCGDQINIHNLTKSLEINYQKQCSVYKTIENINLQNISSTISILSNTIQPNLTVFDLITHSWSSNFTYIDHHNVRIFELMRDIKQNRQEYEAQLEIIKNSQADIGISSVFASFLQPLINLPGTIKSVLTYSLVGLFIICMFLRSFRKG